MPRRTGAASDQSSRDGLQFQEKLVYPLSNDMQQINSVVGRRWYASCLLKIVEQFQRNME